MASDASGTRPDGYTVEYRQGGGFRRLIAELLGEPPRAVWTPPPYVAPQAPAQGESPPGAPSAPPAPPAPPSLQASRAPIEIDRLGLAWRGKFWILLATALAAGAAYAGCSVLPPTYESKATLRVVVHSGTGVTQDAVLASNDLAVQYAPLVRSSAVLGPAAARLGPSGKSLSQAISTGTVGDQNLMAVSAQGGSQREAQRRANAVARQFVTYIRATNRQQVASYSKRVSATLSPIQAQISALQAQLSRSSGSNAQSSTSAGGTQATLATLMTARQRAAADLAQGMASSQPQVDLIDQAGAGVQVQPKPMLYVLVTGLAALLLTLQLVIVVGARRQVAAAA
jgi:capsular polysaccharide biosynthesis protein